MIPGDFGVNRLITRPHDYGETALVFYVRPGGDDADDGLSPATAFATFGRAVREMDLYSVNRPVILDITGMTGANAISGDEVLNLGGTNLGGISFANDLTATSPNNFFSRRHRQIRSELAQVMELDVTGTAFDPVTGLLTLTVSDALVLNALRGQFAVGSVLGEYATIVSNTGGAGPNTIEVASVDPLTAPVGVYEPGATIRFGDAGDPSEGATYLLALCDWSLQGIFFESNGKPAALAIWPNAPVDITLCDLAGVEVNGGAGVVTLDGCFVHDEIWSQDGAVCTVQRSVYYLIDFLCHGSGGGGLNEWIGLHLLSCTPFGGGNVESAYNYLLSNVQVTSAINDGVHALYGSSRLRDCAIDNCGKSAVLAQGAVMVTLDNVQGSGNAAYGVEAYLGAIVETANATAVTGATNDLFIGALGANAWASVPLTDLDELVRVE